MTATMPQRFQVQPDEHLAGMPLDEWRWTLPWALDIDARGHGYLLPRYPAKPGGPAGTLCLKVKRTRDGYVVDLRHVYSDYKWEPRGTRGTGLRVVEFIS